MLIAGRFNFPEAVTVNKATREAIRMAKQTFAAHGSTFDPKNCHVAISPMESK
jgi:hypothetical protein